MGFEESRVELDIQPTVVAVVLVDAQNGLDFATVQVVTDISVGRTYCKSKYRYR